MMKIYIVVFLTSFLFFNLNKLNAQTKSPAQQLSNYVDPFTGDFKYNIPLLTLSGPNGEKFPLDINYSGGIRVNEEASWVGLGWNLNIGEIKRFVKGIPDDYTNAQSITDEIANSQSTWSNTDNDSYFGPLYFADIYNATPPSGATKKIDIYVSKRDMPKDEFPFQFPDYDAYYVSGPGVSGEMRPFLLDYAEYPAYPDTYVDGSRTEYYTTEAASYDVMREFSKKPIFRFVTEPMAEVKNRLSVNNSWRSYTTPETGSAPFYYERFPDPDATGNRNDWFNRNNDLNVYDAANYIEYFTNEQIYNHHTTAGPHINGFIDYEVVTINNSDRNNSAKYDPKGIGAFRVTTPNGITYHYSLPVYTRDEKITSAEFTQWNTLSKVTKNSKLNKYAYTWKLTAITDYRYEDSNGNNFPDEGDKGFWIRVNYTKWSSDYNFKSPYYNYNANLSTRKTPFDNEVPDSYTHQGIIAEGNSELYYPEYIKTSTQTAFFIKGVRSDEHSIANGSGVYTPKLFLKQIVLLDNKDITDNNIFATPQAVTSTSFTNLSSVANTSNTLSTEDYNYYQTIIESKALKTIEFDYDYHLSQKLYNNINNTFSETAVTFGSTSEEIYKNGSYVSTTDASASGKLTLNQLTTYELNHQQITPSYLFNYGTNNPDYNHETHDIYGYYKDNYNTTTKNRYLTTDHDKVDAWSLKKITTPLKGEISIDYESDSYNAIGYDGQGGMPYKPTRVFKMTYADLTGSFSSVGISKMYIDNNDIDYYYPLSTRTKVFVSYVNSGCACYAYYSNSFSGTLTTGSPSELVPTTNTGCFDNGGSCSPPDFVEGYIHLEVDNVYGGGIRVKTIAIKNSVTENYELNYVYEDGMATTEPDIYARLDGIQLKRSHAQVDRHAANASVGYTKVKMYIGEINNNIGSTEYTFNNIDAFNITVPSAKTYYHEGALPIYDYKLNYSVFTVKEDNSLYGRVNAIANYDKNGINVDKMIFEYEDAKGGVDELFYDFLKVSHLIDYYYKRIHWKRTYMSHLKKQTYFKDGITTVIMYDGRDNFTGIPKSTATITPTVNSVKITEMAYSSNTAMGAKTTDDTYANILLPVREERLYKKQNNYEFDHNYQNGLGIDGTKSTWSNSLLTRSWDNSNDKYITTSANSLWTTTETYAFNGITSGNFNWKKLSTTSLFAGRNGELIVEMKDMKDNYSAMKYGYDDRFKIAEVSNCNYTSFAFSSFESVKEVETGIIHFDGEIEKGSGVQKTTVGLIKPHTGDYMLELGSSSVGGMFKAVVDNVTVSGEDFERGIQVGRTYIASVWVHKDSPGAARLVFELDGNITDSKNIRKDSPEGIQIGDWIQLNLLFEVPSNYLSTGGPNNNNDVRIYLENPDTGVNTYFDDLVIHPVDAQFSGYVYDERLGLVMATINNENFYTRYEYDNAAKLLKTFKETQNGEKVINTSKYNYK